MTEMLTIIPPKTKGSEKPALPPKILVDYTPEYIRERLDGGDFERCPEADEFIGKGNCELCASANMKMIKAPSSTQIIEGLTTIGTILTVFNDALKKGRDVYETLVDWIGSNKDMSDSEKVQALQIGRVLAKEIAPSEKEAPRIREAA